MLITAATPLTNGAINETLRHTFHISQGSVATHLMCGGISSDIVIAIFPDFDSKTISKIG